MGAVWSLEWFERYLKSATPPQCIADLQREGSGYTVPVQPGNLRHRAIDGNEEERGGEDGILNL